MAIPNSLVWHPVLSRIMDEIIGSSNLDCATLPQLQGVLAAFDRYCHSSDIALRIGQCVNNANLFIIMLDGNKRIVSWNDYAVTLTGYFKDEVIGRHLLQELPYLIPLPMVTSLESALAECGQGHSTRSFCLPILSKSGQMRQLLCTASPIRLLATMMNGILLLGQDTAIQSIASEGNTIVNTNAIARALSNVASVPPVAAAIETPVLLEGVNRIVANTNGIMYPPVRIPTQQVFSKFPGWDEVSKDYIIECVLGQGSYGQVARARHLPTAEIVAIKKIQNVFADPIDAKRILRELCLLRQLNHRNIVQIREIFRPKNINTFQDLFVVFEYLPTDLEKLLHSPQFLSANHLRWLLLDLLKALKYMHSAHVVHRDLKPANVLLNTSPMTIKICDFGLARGLDTTLADRNRKRWLDPHGMLGTNSSGVHPRAPQRKMTRQLTEHVVTRWYRAPEIIFRDHNYTTEIDIWSIGCIFAELLSMQQSSVSSHYHREPLFPGVSCFPLSPGANSSALPQDSRDQLNVIMDVLGTMPSEDIDDVEDPNVRAYLRSLSPRQKKSFRDMYSGAETSALELLEWMLQMNPRKRATVDQALRHRYLDSIRNLEEETIAPSPIKLDFDEKLLTIPEIRKLITDEIRYYHPDNENEIGGYAPGIPEKRTRVLY